MEQPPFRFKQFSVQQHKCAMKVNTDGVLLGAWQQGEEAGAILDIGTGTGVIALMMAQKNPKSLIDAIDIDADAYLQAKQNFLASAWSERLTCYHQALQNFNPGKKYDLIISNPPYFADDLKSGNHKKNLAKHSTGLSYDELITGAAHLLTKNGKIILSLPAFNYTMMQTLAARQNFFTSRLTEVIAVKGKAPYLVLVQFEPTKYNLIGGTLIIQNPEGDYTQVYMDLTKEFYLKF